MANIYEENECMNINLLNANRYYIADVNLRFEQLSSVPNSTKNKRTRMVKEPAIACHKRNHVCTIGIYE